MLDFLQLTYAKLAPNGAVIIFMSIMKVESIIEIAQKAGFYYKTTGIWHKTNPMPRNMNLTFVNSTEAWIYFVKKVLPGLLTIMANYCTILLKLVLHQNLKRIWKASNSEPEKLINTL
jgi:site-specific DNA-methyltransferase (adenine-specific)